MDLWLTSESPLPEAGTHPLPLRRRIHRSRQAPLSSPQAAVPPPPKLPPLPIPAPPETEPSRRENESFPVLTERARSGSHGRTFLVAVAVLCVVAAGLRWLTSDETPSDPSAQTAVPSADPAGSAPDHPGPLPKTTTKPADPQRKTSAATSPAAKKATPTAAGDRIVRQPPQPQAPKAGELFTDGFGLRFRWIPSGTFTVGKLRRRPRPEPGGGSSSSGCDSRILAGGNRADPRGLGDAGNEESVEVQ